jgi:NodT family efflux transporter outer membrane factor (OMF) lipoprotein
MTRTTALLTAALAASLTGCTVGPKYEKPPVPAAPAYSEAPPPEYQESNGWKPAHPKAAQLRGKWWEIFDDPELSLLEEQIPRANQTLKAAYANFTAARANITYNRAALYPALGTSPGITANRISANTPAGIPGSEYSVFTFPVDLSYEVDLWGRIRRTVAVAGEQFQASAADLENVKLELEADLATDYFELRALDAQKKLLDDTVSAYQRALQLTQNRYRGGVASRVDVAQAQTQLDTAQALDIDATVARAQYQHAIAILIGKTPEEFALPPMPLRQQPPPVPIGVPSELLERRPDIAAAERRMAAANEQIGIARTAFFPQLLISATGGFQAGNIVNWFAWPSRFWAAGPQMLETVFDAGQRRAGVEIARANYQASIADYRQTALTAFQQVEDSLSTLRILEQETAKQHEATAAAEDSLQLSINRYKGGLVTYLEVTTAQGIAYSNERNDVDLLRRRMDATIQLIKALGGGWDVSRLPHN